MEPCGEGYYSLLSDPTCTACPAGYRCPQVDNDPISCDPGYYRYRTMVGTTWRMVGILLAEKICFF